MRSRAILLAAVISLTAPFSAAQQKQDFTAAGIAAELQSKGAVSLRYDFFEDGKPAIRAEAAKAMGSVGELLQSNPDLKIDIQVHSDNTGAAAASLQLSRNRAAAFKTYLVDKLGIAAERLTANGFGGTRPVVSNDNEEGRAQNRRVDLVRK